MPDEEKNKVEADQAQNATDQTTNDEELDEGDEDSGTTPQQAVQNLVNEVLRCTGQGGVLRSRARAQAAHLNNLALDVQKHMQDAGQDEGLVSAASLNTVVDDQNRTGPSSAVKSADTAPGRKPKASVDAITGAAPAATTPQVVGTGDAAKDAELAKGGVDVTSPTSGEVVAKADQSDAAADTKAGKGRKSA